MRLSSECSSSCQNAETLRLTPVSPVPDKLNRASVNDTGYVFNYAPTSSLNQYTNVNGQTAQYDIRFNLYQYNGWQFDHDAPNHLISVTGNGHSGTFTYDGLGRCVRRTIDGVTRLFAYDGWKAVTEYDGNGNLHGRRVYGAGADELLERGDWDYGWFYYHTDRLGNVAFMLDSSGNVLEKYSYDAFGWPTVSDWWGNPRYDGSGNPVSWYGNTFMFTGREFLSPFGIYDYRHRYYYPRGLGRFIEDDPTGFDAGDINLFRYCDDDPVDKSDPTGLLPISSPDFRWSHLMWEQGNSPHGFDDLYQEYVNRAAGDHGAGGGGRETFRTAREAADSRAPEVTNAAIDQSKLPVEKRREPYSAIGQAEDGSSSYVASQIKYGRTLGDIRELRRKNLGTKALRSDITKEDLPRGYQHLVGYVLGHMAFHADYVTADLIEAKQRGLGVAIIVAPGNKRHPLPYYIPHEKDHPDPVY